MRPLIILALLGGVAFACSRYCRRRDFLASAYGNNLTKAKSLCRCNRYSTDDCIYALVDLIDRNGVVEYLKRERQEFRVWLRYGNVRDAVSTVLENLKDAVRMIRHAEFGADRIGEYDWCFVNRTNDICPLQVNLHVVNRLLGISKDRFCSCPTLYCVASAVAVLIYNVAYAVYRARKPIKDLKLLLVAYHNPSQVSKKTAYYYNL